MHLLAPFADFDADAWQEKMKAGGFTPAGAMKLYDEIRQFGHFSLRGEPMSEVDKIWDEARVRISARLRAIETPDDFQQYLGDQAALICGGKNTSMDDKIKFINTWMEQGNYNRIDKGDLIKRLTGSMQFDEPEQWQAWDDVGMEWDDLPAVMGYDRLKQPGIAGATTDSEALSLLENSVRNSGLRGVEWGVVTGGSSQVIADTAHNIEQANRLLEKRSGWQGGVLGLNGRINLRLGLDYTGNGGTCAPLGLANDLYHLNTNASTGWGVVSHEWLHGLDFAMGHRPAQKQPLMASEMPERKGSHTAPWKQMIGQMMGHRFDFNSASLIQSELNDGFRRRWTGPDVPVGLADVLDELRAQKPGKLLTAGERKKQHAKITKFLKDNNPEKGNFAMRAEVAMTEMDLLREQSRLIEEGGSIWVQFANKFKENVNKYHANLASDWADYFLMPSEQAAHSFEATFTEKGCFITDVYPEQSALRYPLPSEAMAQNLSWRRLFKEITPWWQKQNRQVEVAQSLNGSHDAPLAIAARMGDRISCRRKNQGTTVESGLSHKPR